MASIGNTELSTTYQKKTQKEHIKDAPDTYVGAIEPDDVKNWSFKNDNLFVLRIFQLSIAIGTEIHQNPENAQQNNLSRPSERES